MHLDLSCQAYSLLRQVCVQPSDEYLRKWFPDQRLVSFACFKLLWTNAHSTSFVDVANRVATFEKNSPSSLLEIVYSGTSE